MSVLGACVLWTYFLAFIMKEVKWRKLNSWEKVILMLSLITTPTLAAAVAAAFFVLEGGVATSGYRLIFSCQI